MAEEETRAIIPAVIPIVQLDKIKYPHEAMADLLPDVKVATTTSGRQQDTVVEKTKLVDPDDTLVGPDGITRRLLRIEQLLYFTLSAKDAPKPNSKTDPESARIFTELLEDLRKDVIDNG